VSGLEVRELSVSYGGLVAVDEVDLDVPEGAIVGLIGPNGAGKTTCIDAICGFVHATGHVRLGDRRLDDVPAHERARAGVVRTFQSVELFDDLTVRENLVVAAAPSRWWSFLADAVRPRRATFDVDWALEALDLRDAGDARPRELSAGARRVVGLARAIVSRPRVVLLDEPAAGLDPAESAALGDRLRTLPQLGISVLLVDHDMHLVMGVCEQVTVLDFGRVIARGTPAVVRADPAVTRAYLGTTR
jgi:branched-chain amino acid transport system ATP-binding protein